MNDPITISKNKLPDNSTNYTFLVEEGMKYLRKLAGDSWTDHNVHDPGITILETLCYAITELGSRGQLDISELLDPELLPEEMALFSPEKALICNAITVSDFQHLLIDLPIVKFARFKPLNTTSWKGVYEVFIEWEDAALNDNLVQATIVTTGGNVYGVEFAFSYMDELPVLAWSVSGSFDQVIGSAGGDPVLLAFEEGEINDYFTNVKVVFDSVKTAELTIVMKLVDQPAVENRTDLENAIVEHLKLVNTSIATYRLRLKTVSENIISIKSFLADHRNLCEDFVQFTTSRTQEIALQATIELAGPADVQQTLTNILSAIDIFINPVMHFRGLKELQSEGLAFDEIYEGVLLSNGFLNKEYKEEHHILYGSDLLRLILQDDEGNRNDSVIAVTNFSMSSYIGNRLIANNVIECLQLLTNEQYQPRLSLVKTQFTFLRNGVEVKYDREKIIQAVEKKRRDALKTLSVQNSLVLSGNDFENSAWTPETIAEYYSIQNDFPQVYGLQGSIPEGASPERKAQAKQLQAYLLFFEQILANHLAQLSNTANFFSINTDNPHTYFYQSLYGNPQIESLLKAFDPSSNWNDFITDRDNGYIKRLNILSESPGEMLRRKNNILDHLLARFGEDLTSLSFLMFNLNQHGANSSEEIQRRHLATSWYLLQCKSAFLKEVCSAGAKRATGMEKNVVTLSGLEKKLYLKSGILKKERLRLTRNLTEFFEIVASGGGKETFRIKNLANEVLLTRVPDFTAAPVEEVFKQIRTFITYAVNSFYYQVNNTGTAQWRVILMNDKNETIAEAPVIFPDKNAANAFIENVTNFIYKTYSYEGFYLIEHILLRKGVALKIPVVNTSKTLPDPYSFQATLIFPSGFERDFQTNNLPEAVLSNRFGQQDFRNYMEDIVRQECPAHIIPRIFWLDIDTNPAPSPDALSFNQFENLYFEWLSHFVEGTMDTNPGKDAQDQLIEMLNNIFISTS